MRQLDYQTRVLETLDTYLDALKQSRKKAREVEALAAKNPGVEIQIPNFPEQAWDELVKKGTIKPRKQKNDAPVPFSPRTDGCGRHVPNVTYKVPTGGGKTYLAAHSISKILGNYFEKNFGFVLWIVPSEAIYTQTVKNLKNREHPYRQVLDRASANRTRVLQKGDRLVRQDVETHLCVMVLMLQSSNRESKDTLRMFRDRGDVVGFTPSEGEQQGHAELFRQVPNLDGYSDDLYPMVKDSLGNALRIIRPIVVMDEGQKATSNLAYKTLYGFNPSFVLELTATPKDVTPKGQTPRYANLLVEIMGRELHREDMIKMPLNLDPRQGTDWKTTLQAALDKQRQLDRAASTLQAETGRYIRPIMLVQVERTGKDQRDGGMVHSEDVKEWLLQVGFDDAEIAIKTAEKNDLNQPENMDLLAPTNRVRVIITKSALQEGWDCPFAYILCSLSVQSNVSAVTQLVGRILRQPHAAKTGIGLLDECHVITHHAETGAVVKAIKKGLEQDGLADLVVALEGEGEGATDVAVARAIPRRDKFRDRKIYLPKVLWTDDNDVRALDYETDLLARLDWNGFDVGPTVEEIPSEPLAVDHQIQVISIDSIDSDVDRIRADETDQANREVLKFDPAYTTRAISDLVPNAFVARDIVARVEQGLRARGYTDGQLGRCAGVINDRLRHNLAAAQSDLAEALFKDDVAHKRIRFELRLDGKNWEMPDTTRTMQPQSAPPLANKMGEAIQLSLFAPMYHDDFNGDERNVAVQLDREGTVEWWHRNVAKAEYSLQGWRREKIYPDFIFTVRKADTCSQLVALETKGDHLDNLDTAYKRQVMDFLTDTFDWQNAESVGKLQLENTGDTMRCELILMKDIDHELPKLIA